MPGRQGDWPSRQGDWSSGPFSRQVVVEWAQPGTCQIGVVQVGSGENRAARVRLPQLGTHERGVGEPGTAEVRGPRQIRRSWLRTGP